MKKLPYFFVLIFCLLGLRSLGQGYVSLSGKIVDKQTQKPIANAYIGLMSKGIGTVSNADGQYSFRFPRIASDSILVVAVVGYRTFQQKASTFIQNGKDMLIELEPVRPQVKDSSFIKRFEARDLVVAAIKKVKPNASPNPYLLTGFYTETLQQNGEYVEIKEAVLQSEKDPRPKIEFPEKLKMVRNRVFMNENRASILEGYSFPNGASIVTHSLDIGVPEYLDGNNLFDYRFQLDDTMTYYLDKSVYRVRFWPANASVKGGRSGVITINEADSAFVRMEYEFTANGMKDLLKTGTMDRVFGKTKREPKRLYAVINYKPYLKKWYLQDYELLLDTQFEQNKTQTTGTIHLHFTTTEIAKSNGGRIAPTDVLLNTDGFSEIGIPKYDGIIWGNFNYVLPTEAMRQITNSLKK